jgi:hypothetical protein
VTGSWFLFTTGERSSAAEVAQAALENGSDGLRLELTLDRSRQGIGALMEASYRRQPDLDFYGWLADDTYPRSGGWDAMLGAAALRHGFACAADGGYIDGEAVEAGGDLSSGLCWAGWLVRAVGWWCPPGLRDAYVDTAWLEIMRPLGLVHYCPHVLVEHRHWRTGKRPQDTLDGLAAEGVERDRGRFDSLREGELVTARQRVERVRGQ